MNNSLKLKGKYTNAEIFANTIENSVISQTIEILNQKVFKNKSIKIMPDVHAGKGCVIGFTCETPKNLIPNIIGVDIGCGMLTVKLDSVDMSKNVLEKLDNILSENKDIPSGFKHRGTLEGINKKYLTDLGKLHCINNFDSATLSKFNTGQGTLGGGNHFIEINKSEKTNEYFLVIHSGSRYLGKKVAELYQNMAYENINNKYPIAKAKLIKEIKDRNIESEIKQIEAQVEKLRSQYEKIPKDLCYLDESDSLNYFKDMNICKEYASNNRKIIAENILKILYNNNRLNLESFEYFETVHNYIDSMDGYIRKGSISAKSGEIILIPMNMEYGSLICEGLGNPDYNYSAPHGAGRIMSRSKAKSECDLNEFKDRMKDVFTSSVDANTIDESPMAYKNPSEIINIIGETVKIIDIIKPVYNFKAK